MKKLGWFLVCLFAVVGLVLVVGFFAVKYGWTNTSGGTDLNDRYFKTTADKVLAVNYLSDKDLAKELWLAHCKWQVIGQLYPDISARLNSTYQKSSSTDLIKLILATEVSVKDDPVYQKGVAYCEEVQSKISGLTPDKVTEEVIKKVESWAATEDWQTFKGAIVKDKEVINKVSAETGVDARLIVAMLAVEQLRLFNSDREVYKQIFQPLKILGVQSKFSWGVMGLKEETAIKIENNLKDSQSIYYLGEESAHLLDFKSADVANERFTRLTDEHNHYYSYLYSALFIKQIILQWQKAGFDISRRPEIIATLFNLGFNKSAPKADPQVGGAEIEVGGQKYSFGGLAFQFYYSGELADDFPIVN